MSSNPSNTTKHAKPPAPPTYLMRDQLLEAMWRICPDELDVFMDLAEYLYNAKHVTTSAPLGGLKNRNFGIGVTNDNTPMAWIRKEDADIVTPLLLDQWPTLGVTIMQCSSSSSYPSLFPEAKMLFARIPYFFTDVVIVGKNTSTSTVTSIGYVTKENGCKRALPRWSGGARYQSKELLEEAMRAWYTTTGTPLAVTHEF